MTLAILGISFIVLILLGVPISFSMGISSVAAIIYTGTINLDMVAHRMGGGIDSFVYLAIPMFILVGTLMDMGGIANRLVVLAKALVGRFKGGLGMTVIVAEMFFSGISGSTVADVSAMCSMLLPSMLKAGYSRAYTIAIICAASALGILIPPCVIMVVLASLGSTSVTGVFIAGFLPAAVLGLICMVLIYAQAQKNGLSTDEPSSFIQVIRALIHSLVPLSLPVIIFGGILLGIATPTEVAAIAVVYALFLGVFVYKKINWKNMLNAFIDAGVSTGTLCMLLGLANIFTYLLATEHVPEMLADFLLATTSSPTIFLIITVFVLIIAASVLEGMPTAVIFVPILLPIIQAMDINILHFMTIVVASVGLGMFLPPAGMGLIIGASLGKVGIEEVMKPFFPFLIAIIFGIIILVIFPWFTTVIPDALKIRY